MFEITTSMHNQKCISIEHPTENIRKFLRMVVLANRIDDPVYIAKENAIPFLQCDYEDYVLVEFWGTKVEEYVAWLNEYYLSYTNTNLK